MPGKKGDLAVSARFINTLKVTLTAKQSPKVMEALARHLEGKPFDKRIIQN